VSGNPLFGIMLLVVIKQFMLGVINAECHYPEWCSDDCHGARFMSAAAKQ
jgi:hypothetical protein